MAYDLLWKKPIDRNFARGATLVAAPPLPIIARPDPVRDALSLVSDINDRVRVEKHGRGAVVSARARWG